MARVAKGNPDAAYPDESNWVGGRRLGVLRGTRMPAVLLELGFMSNPAEIRKLEEGEYLREMAHAVAGALT